MVTARCCDARLYCQQHQSLRGEAMAALDKGPVVSSMPRCCWRVPSKPGLASNTCSVMLASAVTVKLHLGGSDGTIEAPVSTGRFGATVSIVTATCGGRDGPGSSGAVAVRL